MYVLQLEIYNTRFLIVKFSSLGYAKSLPHVYNRDFTSSKVSLLTCECSTSVHNTCKKKKKEKKSNCEKDFLVKANT